MIPRLKHNWLFTSFFAIAALAAAVFVIRPAFAAQGGQSGATLQADKTIEICDNGDGTWTFSGAVAVWNTGTNNATGCQITDVVEQKNVSGPNWSPLCTALDMASCGNLSGTVPGGTDENHAFSTTYSCEAPAATRTVRNNAQVTIDNHSGGRTNGPNPKATYFGQVPPPPCNQQNCGCALTQGYWKTHPEAWSSTADLSVFDFDHSGNGAAEALVILNTPPPQGNGWYILAKQYIAYVLNGATEGACTPTGLQTIVSNAATFFGQYGATNYTSASAAAAAACPSGSSCGTQKADACILDTYNHGLYPEGPTHCGGVTDDEPPLCPTP